MSEQLDDLCPMDALKTTLLGSEWASSAGGLSTLNRELAIQLSQHTEARVSLLVPEGCCTDEDKREAQCYGITVVQAKKRPGYDALDWLSVPPKDHEMDVVVGHGVKLGRQVQIIKDSDRFQNCKWIQVVHTAPEDLSKYKGYSLPISKGEKKHEDEVDLCKLADLVVPIGPELKENYIPRLRRSKKVQDVFSLTPGLFKREFGNLEQEPNESAKFKVLLCGRCDDEDFELKGYTIAAKAFTDPRLKGKPYDLTFVGATDEEKQEEVRKSFLRCGITNEQLTVRKFVKSREKMKDLFCEVDLVIMPSKSEGFGLISLEALSAGLPILVSSRSGFAKAVESIPRGRSFIVDVENPAEWAKKIEDVRTNHRARLEEIKELRASYDKQYSWKEQCEQLVEKMRKLVNGMVSGQTVKDQERSATWNNTGATSSAGSSPSQNTESTPGARWTPPKHEPHRRANVRWTETRSETQNDEKPDLSCRTRAEKAKASRSALHMAAINGQYKTVKMLLDRGEDVDKRDEFSITPLHLACWYGQEKVASLMLENGANANAVDRFHRTPLQKAERHNHHSIVQLLLKNNASPTYHQPPSLRRLSRKAFLQVNRRLGFNLLQAAVYEGDYDIVFKASGLLPGDFVQGMNSKTAENDDHFFSGMNAVDILSCLDEKRRSHAQIDKLYQEDVEKYKTLTELHWCRCSDDTERAVELVLNDGVDPNIPALSNRTPLLWAISSSSSMFVKTLIDLGADVNVQRTDNKATPLGLAASWSNYMNIYLLLEHGADLNIQNSEGDSPLHQSVCWGSFEISNLLIKAGCNVSARNKFHKTPLYLAVEKNDEQVATLLLAHGADVHMQYNQDPTKRIYLVRGKDRGKPAWHYVLVEKFLLGLFLKRTLEGRGLDVKDFGKVLKSGWGVDPPPGTIEKILEDGGDIFKQVPGETLLHVASRNNSTSIIQLLIDFLSRDLNSHDKESFTPLHIAAIHGNMQAVKKLVDLGADVNQSLPVAEVAGINEEFEIEEYLKSKMAFKDGSGERKGELDIVRENTAIDGPNVVSTLQRLRRIGNTIQTEGRVFLEAVAAAAFGSNRT